jgi:repressor LexA
MRKLNKESIREIAKHFKMSVRGAYDHIRALKRKGFLASDGRKARTFTI